MCRTTVPRAGLVVVVALVVLTSAGLGVPASAAVVEVPSAYGWTYRAEPGEANRLTISVTRRDDFVMTVVFTEQELPIALGPGHAARCDALADGCPVSFWWRCDGNPVPITTSRRHR